MLVCHECRESKVAGRVMSCTMYTMLSKACEGPVHDGSIQPEIGRQILCLKSGLDRAGRNWISGSTNQFDGDDEEKFVCESASPAIAGRLAWLDLQGCFRASPATPSPQSFRFVTFIFQPSVHLIHSPPLQPSLQSLHPNRHIVVSSPF